MDGVRDRILAVVQAMREKPVDAVRLDAVKKNLRYSAALRMDSSESIAQTLVGFIALRRTPETMNKLYERYAALTPEDLQHAAAKYLVDHNRTIVTLTSGGAQ
jgi:zinc protease